MQLQSYRIDMLPYRKIAVKIDVKCLITLNFTAMFTAQTVGNIAASSFAAHLMDFFFLHCGSI